MRKILPAVAVAAPTLFFALACSGMPAMGSYENVSACKQYVDAFNKLDCLPDSAKLAADDMCPDALDMSPVDMTEYYTCLADNAKCNGKIPDLGGQADCKPPSP